MGYCSIRDDCRCEFSQSGNKVVDGRSRSGSSSPDENNSIER